MAEPPPIRPLGGLSDGTQGARSLLESGPVGGKKGGPPALFSLGGISVRAMVDPPSPKPAKGVPFDGLGEGGLNRARSEGILFLGPGP